MREGGEGKERREGEGINLPHGRLTTLAALAKHLHVRRSCRHLAKKVNSCPACKRF